jgi:TonB family protein
MSDYSHDIEKYLKGELTPAERHALEKKALNDSFLADALEGAEQINASDFSKDVSQLNERIAGKKTVSVWMWTARIAAGLAFIILSTFVVWNIVETEPAQDLAMEKNEKIETPPTTEDSSTSSTGTLSSPPAEQPSVGPAINEKDVAKQKSTPRKTEKPKGTGGEAEVKPIIKTEPVPTEAIASAEAEKKAEEKAEEIKVTEPIAQARSIEKETQSYRLKADDDQQKAILSKSAGADKKKAAAGAPSAADKSGFAYSQTQRVVRGQVTSAEDGSAIPGVNVVIKGSTIGTVTNDQGNYEVTVPVTDPTLVYSFIGLQSTEVKAENREEVNVQMNMDVTQLSEVVTTGYGVQHAGESSPTVDLAHPEIGNRAYKQYLEKNIRYPELAKTNKTEGRVTVEFTVEPNGTLANFTIIRGIGSGCDEELIRLIKEGPKWVPTKKDNISVQDKAKVRLKFELPK